MDFPKHLKRLTRRVWAFVTAAGVLVAFTAFETRFDVQAERPQSINASLYAARITVKNEGVFRVFGAKLHCEAGLVPAFDMEKGKSLGTLNSGGISSGICNFSTSSDFQKNLAVGRSVRVWVTYRPVFLFFGVPQEFEFCKDFWFAAQLGEDGKIIWSKQQANERCS
jgi:hypothetical protein